MSSLDPQHAVRRERQRHRECRRRHGVHVFRIAECQGSRPRRERQRHLGGVLVSDLGDHSVIDGAAEFIPILHVGQVERRWSSSSHCVASAPLMSNLLRLDGLKDYLFGGSARKSRRRTGKDNAAGQTRSMHRLRKSNVALVPRHPQRRGAAESTTTTVYQMDRPCKSVLSPSNVLCSLVLAKQQLKTSRFQMDVSRSKIHIDTSI